MAVRPEGCVYARLNAEAIPRIVREHLAGGCPVRALIPKGKDSALPEKKAKKQLKAARKAEKHARRAAKKAKKRLAAGLMERAA
jgi:(2Fe-2S) ferredoxin